MHLKRKPKQVDNCYHRRIQRRDSGEAGCQDPLGKSQVAKGFLEISGMDPSGQITSQGMSVRHSEIR